MTDTTPQPTTNKSSTRTIIIIVVAIVVLAGGAFVVYKLTNKKDPGPTAMQTARKAIDATDSGNQAALVKITTAQGRTQIVALKGKMTGFKVVSCGPAPFTTDGSRLCLFSRPGGQLQVLLSRKSGSWLVDQAKIGPAGLPPTTTTSTT